MPDLKCFTGTSLQKEFEDKLKEGGLSEKEAASQVIIDEHKRLHDALNRLKASPELKDFNLGQDEYVLPIDAEAIDNQKRRNEAEIAALQNELGDKEKVVTSQQIEKDANDIITGKKVFERFSQDEQRGLAEGGAIHVEASLILAADERTGRPDNPDTELQESKIEDYARSKGIWYDNTTQELTNQLGKQFKSGEEAIVWRSEDGITVTKSQGTDMYTGDLQQKLDGITLQNTIFPEATIKVIGFGRDGKNFQVIVEQRFVKADPILNDKNIPREVEKKTALKEEYLKKLGFEETESGHLSNGETIIEDVHNGNVIIDPEGNIVVIDPIMRLNISEQGYGGKRIVKNETTQQQAGEADKQGDQPGQKTEPDTAAANQTGETAEGDGKEPPGKKPPVDEGTGEEGKSKGNFNFFKNRDIPLTDEQKTHLSKPTLEVSGQEITQPFEYNVVTLDSMIDAGKRWMAEAKKQFNASKSEYAIRLFRDLRAMKGRMAVKAVGMVNLLNSIDNDLQFGNLTDGDRDRMRYVRGQLIDEIADNAREGSLTLNAQRLIHKLYKGEYKFTETMASVVTTPVQQAADDVATKLKKGTEEVSETVRENKRKKAAKEDTGDTPPAKPKKKEPKEKKTTFFSKALGAVDQEAIDKLKQQISDLAKDVKCGGK